MGFRQRPPARKNIAGMGFALSTAENLCYNQDIQLFQEVPA